MITCYENYCLTKSNSTTYTSLSMMSHLIYLMTRDNLDLHMILSHIRSISIHQINKDAFYKNYTISVTNDCLKALH